jgi:hypothetical protein
MPNGKVIIIIPSQGEDKNSFEAVALLLKKKVYRGNATIIKTRVTDLSGVASVAFTTFNGHPFLWGITHNVSRVLTISHGAPVDGPILAISVPEKERQPIAFPGRPGSAASGSCRAEWETVMSESGPYRKCWR